MNEIATTQKKHVGIFRMVLFFFCIKQEKLNRRNGFINTNHL